MTLRPDEMANLREIERDHYLRGLQAPIGKAAGAAIAGATGLGGGLSGLQSRIMPLLNEYVPMDLAMKGLKKIAPKISDFLEKGISYGLDPKEGMEYIKEQMQQPSQTEQPKGTQNIIEQSSPELHQYIVGELNKGRTPTQVASMSKNIGQFKKVIDELRKQHNIDWFDLIEELYGQGKAQGTPMQQESGVGAALSQQPQQPQGPSEAMQRLTSLLQRGSQILNG